MKQLVTTGFYKHAFMVFLFTISNIIAWAQDSTVSSSTRTSSTTTTESKIWYAEPWVWVVGGVVLLLLIVLLSRGSGRTDKVTVTKTRTTD